MEDWLTDGGAVSASLLQTSAKISGRDPFAGALTEEWPSSDNDPQEGIGRINKKALDREVPWRLIVGGAEEAAFVSAVQRHWAEWKRWEVVRRVPRNQRGRVKPKQKLPGRTIFRGKPVVAYFNDTNGQRQTKLTRKASARIVLQGFRDYRLEKLVRDAPVASRNGIILLLQVACNNHQDVNQGDCKSAFLQGTKYGTGDSDDN